MLVNEDTNKFWVRLAELAPKILGVIPWLEEPSYEQKEWFVRRMHGSKKSWEVWDQ